MPQPKLVQNYSTYAVSALLEFAKKMKAGNHPDAADVESLAADIRGAHKYDVPHECLLLRDRLAVGQPLEMTRLPHPAIVIETNMRMPEGSGGNTNPTPRVILAQEVIFDKETSKVSIPGPEEEPNAIRIDMAALMDPRYGWMPRPCGVLIMIGDRTEIVEIEETDEQGNKLLAQEDFTVITYPRLTITSQSVRNETSSEAFAEQMATYVEVEVRAVAEMLAVLSCENISTQIGVSPEKMVKARKRSGKDPFFDTHVLVVGDDNSGSNSLIDPGAIKSTANDRKIWVNRG